MNNVSVCTDVNKLCKVSKEDAIKGIREWKHQSDRYVNNEISVDNFLKYFDNISLFNISQTEIASWDTKLKNLTSPKIHMYAGIHAGKGDNKKEFCFYLIDSKSDKEGDFSGTIFKKTFQQLGDSNKIEIAEAKRRINDWGDTSTRRSWATRQTKLFRFIEIDYSDYQNLDLKPNECCNNYLALKERGAGLHIEVIAVNGNLENMQKAEDYSVPRPPFTNFSNYQLMMHSSIIL